MRKLTLLAAAAFAATTTPAAATITFGNQTVGQGQTVQFISQPNGPSVLGFTNQTNTSVTFQTLTGQTLSTPSNGQARVEAINTATGATVPLTSILIFLTDPTLSFTYAEFNMSNAGNPGNASTVTVYALDNLGNPFSQVFNSLGNGQNFVSFLQATNGDTITSISFNNTGNSGFTDLEQLRINGITGPNGPPPTVPESSTWALMLLGFGATGIAIRRNRRRKAVLGQLA